MQSDKPDSQHRIFRGSILILVAVLALTGLAACGGDDENVDEEADATIAPPTVTESANAAEPTDTTGSDQTGEATAVTSPTVVATEANPTGTPATQAPEGAATGTGSAEVLGSPTATGAAPAGSPPGDNVIELSDGFTKVEFNGTYEDALESANINFKAIEPAQQEDDYDVELLVTSGTINLQEPSGIIKHDGGLRFAMGDAAIDFTDIVVDLDSRAVTATVNGQQMTILTLDLAGISREDNPDPNITIGFSNIIGIFTQPAADAINSALGVDVFKTDTKVDVDLRLAGE